MRLLLDERFVVRSLDGIVDYRLNQFATEWGVDHIGYIREREIEYLLDFPNYNIRDGKFSLADLAGMKVGEEKAAEGFVFKMMYSKVLGKNCTHYSPRHFLECAWFFVAG